MYIAISNSIGASSRVNGGGGSFSNTYSLALDGVDDYLNCGDVTTLSNASTFTYSGWYKQTTLDVSAFMFGSYIDTNNWIAIYTWSNGFHYVGIRKAGATTYTKFDYSTVVTVGQWFHFVAVYDGSLSGNDKMKLYFDGVLVTTSYVGVMPTSTATGVQITNIGKAEEFVNTWNGSADECSLFSTAKTGLEITDIYNSGTPTDLSALAGLTNWYRNGDNGTWKSPQWLIPSNENKDKVSNYSMDFDGLDDKIDLGTISTLNNVSNFSISFRMKMTATTAFNWWFGGYTSAGNNIYIGITGGNTRAYINGAYVQTSITIANKIILGADATVTVVYDGSLVGNLERVKIYVDGQDTVGTPTSGGTIPVTTSIGTVGYGFGGLNGYASFVTGYSDNLLIFDYSLTYAQTLDIYNGGIPKDVSYLNPAHHWKMGDNATFLTNWTVPDAVGSNDGTSANMTIEDRIGDAPNSTNNAVSLNMDEVDRQTDVPT